MTTMIRYRLKCITEDAFQYWNLPSTDPPPTTCPVNASHTIDTNTIVIVSQGSTGPQESLDNLADVGFTGISGISGTTGTTQILVFNPTTGKWQNRELFNPMGEIFFGGDGTSTYPLELTNQSEWYQIGITGGISGATGFFLFSNDSQFPTPCWSMPSVGRLKWGLNDSTFAHCAYSLSAAVETAADLYQVSLFKNGSLIIGSISSLDFITNNIALSYTYNKIVTLAPNDIIDMRIRDITASNRTMLFNNSNFGLIVSRPRGF